MIGILYFSSTGNSLYIAKKVQEALGGEIKYIPNYLGTGKEYEQLVIVTPIYSYGMPTPVYDLLPKLDKRKPIIVIQNYGGMVGGADYLFYDYAKNKLGLNVVSMYKIKMIENFTLYFTVPKYYQNIQLKKCVKRVENTVNKILKLQYFLPEKTKTKEQKYLKNKSNWHLIGRDFCANKDCIKCGKCVSICPVKNIVLEDGKITFGDKCIACLGCYHRCPKKAIEFKNKHKKYRYVNPYINENDIGKDL